MKTREVIDGDIHWFICRCGNEPYFDGFYSCSKDGEIVSPIINGDWDGLLYVCYRCGRIINQDTLEVVGVTGEKAAFHNANYDWENY